MGTRCPDGVTATAPPSHDVVSPNEASSTWPTVNHGTGSV